MMSKEIFTDMTGSNKSIYNKRLIAGNGKASGFNPNRKNG